MWGLVIALYAVIQALGICHTTLFFRMKAYGAAFGLAVTMEVLLLVTNVMMFTIDGAAGVLLIFATLWFVFVCISGYKRWAQSKVPMLSAGLLVV